MKSMDIRVLSKIRSPWFQGIRGISTVLQGSRTPNSSSVIPAMLLVFVLLFSGCIDLVIDSGIEDRDGDGIPDDEDEFPDDEDESKDSDGDGVGDNSDPDDDNDGVNDDEDAFPYDRNESSDNDLDGVGDNVDPDDDNDGYNDSEDVDPLHDLALSFSFPWVNLTVPVTKRSTGYLFFDLYREDIRLKRFDDHGNTWRIPWQTQYNLTATFELNVPDNITVHEFTVRAYNARWFSSTLLDIGESNITYEGTIIFNLSSLLLEEPASEIPDNSSDPGTFGILNGSSDSGTDEPDAMLAVSVEPFNFGYFKSYEWRYRGEDYRMSYNFDPLIYSSYRSADHHIKRYEDYIDFATPNDDTLIDFADQLHQLAVKENLTELEEAQFFLNFVQSLKYSQDNVTTGIGEYPRFPIETLVDQMGDCEDTSLLLISMTEIIGIESSLLLLTEAFEDTGHAAAGLAVSTSGSHYEFRGTDYYYAETTGIGWPIGEMPEFNSTQAYVYEVM